MNCKVSYLLAIGLWLSLSAAHGEETAAVDSERVRAALERSMVYLQLEGRAWLNGEVDIQDDSACVSCHQVPSGAWSLSAAYEALRQPPRVEFTTLLKDAAEFVSDKNIGRAAMWSQLMIAESGPRKKTESDEPLLLDTFELLILKAQQENGSWPSQGQFPTQRRPIEESDAVVTMWMIHALQIANSDSSDLESSLDRARNYVESSQGISAEWLAWRLLLSGTSEQPGATWRQKLVALQNHDGSWGWQEDEPGNAYNTGVALYALAAKSGTADVVVKKAVAYLLENQAVDGSWRTDSRLISKEGSERRDYVYRYWATAWATIGLAEQLRTEAAPAWQESDGDNAAAEAQHKSIIAPDVSVASDRSS
jgi:hypothetical protein